MHLLWTRRRRNVLIICRRQLLTQTTAADKKKDIKKPATHRVIWLFNSLIQRQGSKFDLQATLYKWNLVASLTISLNNVKYLMVNFLTRYDVKDIYLIFISDRGGDWVCSAANTVFWLRYFKDMHFVSLMFYGCTGF